MLYRVYGKIDVQTNCDCPYCDGEDVYWNRQQVHFEIEADKPESAKAQAICLIRESMDHEDASVDWLDEPEITEVKEEDVGVDVLLLKMNAEPLFPLKEYMKGDA